MHTIDLHVHSNASDGSMTPSELVTYAIEQNLCAFALTDHDTVEGVAQALKAADGLPLEVIPGIEISAEYKGQDIHILGYYIDYKDQEFLKTVGYYRHLRENRNVEMLARLQGLGFPITASLLEERFGRDTVITRAHYAMLLQEKGIVKDTGEAFERFLNPGCPCYVPRTKISVTDAVRLIIKAKGKPVLAHPVLYHLDEIELDTLTALLKEAGLMGIEAIYSKNQTGDEDRFRALAKKYHLFITGGSDFHGTAKPGLMLGTGYGNLAIPAELLDNLR